MHLLGPASGFDGFFFFNRYFKDLTFFLLSIVFRHFFLPSFHILRPHITAHTANSSMGITMLVQTVLSLAFFVYLVKEMDEIMCFATGC